MINMDYAQKMHRCHDYVEALEEERRKVQVFQRELPLCLELVTQAIEACKKEISGVSRLRITCKGNQSVRRRHRMIVLFWKNLFLSEGSLRKMMRQSHNSKENVVVDAADDKKKSDWLRCVQLWNNNQSPDPSSKEDVGRLTASTVEMKRNGGAFQPFHREKSLEKKSVGKGNASATSTSTTESGSRGGADNGNSNKKEEKEVGQPQRKQRRCWSSELHRRFLHALHQLGGSHVATPKQIRELMKVDGLTNDEVKSHLQKYRLHTRRPSPSVNNGNPQFVVVGGIWVPPQDYASVTAASGETASVTPSPNNGVYAPVAVSLPTLAQPSVQRPQSEERGEHSEGRVHSSSPSTSSSTHTTTDHSPLV
ncbi:putative uv excision repair protein rad23 [Hibiscus syriacus]|uniref:Uv excision repair protein rad23 n=1 Tax=Hibiscus syriacus TaxID=106335 RepID=A0A6A2WLX2_HIBSY|nr:putative uv excision repair protein rad23 [Hibiscus syriacus]